MKRISGVAIFSPRGFGNFAFYSIIAQISEPVLLPEGFGNFLFYAAYILPRLKSPCWAVALKYDKICVF